jgi:hypothetical protein
MNLILNPEIENFEEVRKYLSNIPNINYGGCGVAALSMYRWLEKNKNKKSNLVICYNNSEKYEKTIENLGKDNDKLFAPSHCGIKYKNNFLDARENIFIAIYCHSHLIDEKKMLQLINFGDFWSEEFERGNTREISQRLKIDLSDVFI